MIMKRFEDGDGLQGFSEVARFYVELTGQGMRELMRDVQHPTVAKKDEDVMKMVEEWEDEYKQAVRQGMLELSDLHKITILEEKARRSINLLKIRKSASFDKGFHLLSFSIFAYWN